MIKIQEVLQDIPKEHRNKFWYYTTHGYGPGTIPKDVEVLDTIDNGFSMYILLDRPLEDYEIKKYDLKVKNPPYELLQNSTEMQRHRNGEKDYLTFDY